MADTFQSLLLQAQTEATPFTRRVSKQLALTAVGLMALALLIAASPVILSTLSSAASAVGAVLGTSWNWVVDAASSLGALFVSSVRLVSGLLATAFGSFSGLYSMVLTTAALVCLNAWYRARRYVMQSAVDLVLKSNVTIDEGQKLVQSFMRTHFRVNAAMVAVAVLCVAQAIMSIEALAEGAPIFKHTALQMASMSAWLALFFAGLFTAFSQVELSERNIAAYAMFRGARMSPAQFRQDLAAHKENRYEWASSMVDKLTMSGLLKMRGFKGLGPLSLVQQSLAMSRRGSFDGRPALD